MALFGARELSAEGAKFGHHSFERDSDKLREFRDFGKHALGRWTEEVGFVLQDSAS